MRCTILSVLGFPVKIKALKFSQKKRKEKKKDTNKNNNNYNKK
jgi:hypothetical protein